MDRQRSRGRVRLGPALILLHLGCRGASVAPISAEPPPEPLRPPEGALRVPSEGLEADLEATRAFHATRPIYERPLGDGLELPAGLGGIAAEDCGSCHQAILEEWRVSTHALAWVDPQFQEEIRKSDNRWLCLNCHSPLLVQQDYWPRDLVEGDVERPVLSSNPVFDASLRAEGISCAGCHVREGRVHGPGLPGSLAPHPVVVDEDLSDGSGLCLRCHQAVARYEGKNFVCTFRTGEEWRAGPYDEEGQTCVSCHMPRVRRPAALGGPERQVARHWWRGAGIPKIEGVHPPPEALPPGLGLRVEREEDGLAIHMRNARAGHRLPTGDPERWIEVRLRFFAAGGQPIGEPWEHRIGQVWSWDPPTKHADNRLAPLEARVRHIPLPPGAERAIVTASSHRMTDEIATYHGLLGIYPRSIRTHRIELMLR